MAKLSAHTYDTNAPVPPGYTYLDPTTPAGQQKLADIGVKPDDLSPSTSQFRAQIFETGTSDNPSYVVAFKGSTSGQDWTNNFQQGVGLNSDYYTRAVTLGNLVNQTTDGQVVFTGHSLGGGLASAAADAAQQPATTFNAAGLSASTIKGLPPNPSTIDAYHVAGEILTGIQSSPIARALDWATSGKVAPQAIGNHYTLPAVPPSEAGFITRHNPVARHGMDWVERGIAAKKTELGCP